MENGKMIGIIARMDIVKTSGNLIGSNSMFKVHSQMLDTKLTHLVCALLVFEVPFSFEKGY